VRASKALDSGEEGDKGEDIKGERGGGDAGRDVRILAAALPDDGKGKKFRKSP
jgi:hypothetical protein